MSQHVLRGGLADTLRGLGHIGIWLGVSACSAQTMERQDCETHQQCREAFGLGSTCGQDGLCSAAVRHPRCERTYPEGLFDGAREEQPRVIFGTLFDQGNETHRARENAVRLAVSQVNEQGGVEGREFGLVLCNIAPGLGDGAESTEEGALAVGEYLADTLELPVLLGPSASGDVSALFERLRPTGALLISPAATSPALTALDGAMHDDQTPGRLWRTAPPDSLQGTVIAEDMKRREVARVAVIAKMDEYGGGLSEIFLKQTTAKVDLHVFGSAGELSETVVRVGNSDVEEVLFIASAQDDVAAFLNAAGSLAGYVDKRIFLTDSAATQNTLDSGADALFPRIRGTRPQQASTQDPVYGTFVAAYQAEYRRDVTAYSFTAHAYDMTWLAMLGTAWAVLREDRVDGLSVAHGARRLSAGEEFSLTPSNWRGMVQRFRTGKDVDIRGASGALDFDPTTEETAGPIEVWTIGAAPPSFVVDAVEGR